MKKRILIALGVLVLAAGIGAGGWYYYTHHAGAAGGSDIVYVTKISKLSEMVPEWKTDMQVLWNRRKRFR